MAKCEYGSIITDMIGSIGGLTFQHNASGKIVRLKPVQRIVPSVGQSVPISNFNTVANAWSVLSSANKTAWQTFSDTYTFTDPWGVTKSMNGYNWFMSINGYLKVLSASLLTSPPTYSSPLAVAAFTAVFEDSYAGIDFGTPFAHTNHDLLIYTTPPMTAVSQNARSPLRLTEIVSGGTDTEIDFSSDYENVHGISLPLTGYGASVNMLVCVQSVHSTDGIASAYAKAIDAYNIT